MSTYWGFKCNTCGVTNEERLNHGDDQFANWLKNKDSILKVWDLTQTDGWLQLSVMGCGSEPIEFLAQHRDHEVVVMNEYGQVRKAKT